MAGEKNDRHPTPEVLNFFSEFPKNDPFLAWLGAKAVAVKAGEAKLLLDLRHDHLNVHGIAHGGVATTLVDTAMGASCYSLSKGVVSLSTAVEFIKAIPAGHRIHAIGHVLHNGRRTMACEGEVVDATDGTLYLKATGTFFVLKDYDEDDAAELV